jgi:hypothetical protein
MTEDQNGLAEVADLLNLIHQTARMAGVLVPGSFANRGGPDRCFLWLHGLLKGGMPFGLQIKVGQPGVQILGVPGRLGSL